MLRREDSRPALDFRTAAGQDDVGGVGVEVGPEAAAYDAPVAVREVAREVTAENVTDLAPSVGLPEGKVARHLGTMGLHTLPRKSPYLPTSRSDLRQNSAATNPVNKSPAAVASTLRFMLHFSRSSTVNAWPVGNHDQRSASSPNFVREKRPGATKTHPTSRAPATVGATLRKRSAIGFNALRERRVALVAVRARILGCGLVALRADVRAARMVVPVAQPEPGPGHR